jgi:tetrahydromethanopterin S-methyltransferase subunit G
MSEELSKKLDEVGEKLDKLIEEQPLLSKKLDEVGKKLDKVLSEQKQKGKYGI